MTGVLVHFACSQEVTGFMGVQHVSQSQCTIGHCNVRVADMGWPTGWAEGPTSLCNPGGTGL